MLPLSHTLLVMNTNISCPLKKKKKITGLSLEVKHTVITKRIMRFGNEKMLLTNEIDQINVESC